MELSLILSSSSASRSSSEEPTNELASRVSQCLGLAYAAVSLHALLLSRQFLEPCTVVLRAYPQAAQVQAEDSRYCHTSCCSLPLPQEQPETPNSPVILALRQRVRDTRKIQRSKSLKGNLSVEATNLRQLWRADSH